MFQEETKRSRGPKPLSKEEYEEICKEEDKKILASTMDTSIIDDFDPSSIISISDNEVKGNDDFVFETEEKPTELNTMQKVKIARMKVLKDDVEYTAIIKDVNSAYNADKKLGHIHISCDVNIGSDTPKEIEFSFFFNEKKLKSLEVNQDIMEKFLSKFHIELTTRDYEDIKNIEKNIKPIIMGKKVLIVQKSNGEYKNYRVISVLDEEKK